MFLPIKEFERRFVSFEGSSYATDEIEKTILIKNYKNFYWKSFRKLHWSYYFTFLCFFVFSLLFFQVFVFFVLALTGLYLIISFFRKGNYISFRTAINLRDRKFTFYTGWPIRKKRKVFFGDIKLVRIKRRDTNRNTDSTETVFEANEIILNSISHKTGRNSGYSVLKIRNAPEARLMADWFENIVGLAPRVNSDEIFTPVAELPPGYSFRKHVLSSDFQPDDFTEILKDCRRVDICENGTIIQNIWMDADTVFAFSKFSEKTYLIQRLPSPRREKMMVFNVPGADYLITDFSKGIAVAKLSVNNVRKSWKGYNCIAEVDGEIYHWLYKPAGFASILSGSSPYPQTAALISSKGEGLNLEISISHTNSQSNNTAGLAGNNLNASGILDFSPKMYRPVLTMIAVYVLEMELAPIPRPSSF